MTGDDVTIRLKEDTWAELNKRKRPGDSFNDVIQRLIDEHDSLEEAIEDLDPEGNRTTATAAE